jgi:hypothetical protein
MAGYTGDLVGPDDAREIVEQAAIFIATVQARFMPR